MLGNQETNTTPSIYKLLTANDSTIAVSTIPFLLTLADEKSLQCRHISEQLSNVRRNQLHASDVLMAQLVKDGRIERSEGRPHLVGDPRKISISHTGMNLSMIIGSERVAIDMEPTKRSVAKIEHKFQTAEDVKVARESFPENPSLLIWCIKECLFKIAHASGVDFKDHLKLLEPTGNQSVHCEINHPDVKRYLRADFIVFNHLLIAYIG